MAGNTPFSYPDPEYEVRLDQSVLVPMRDGVLLSTDLYFPPEDNAIELRHMPSAELRPFDSAWGHCVANPGNEPAFERFLDDAIRDLLGE